MGFERSALHYVVHPAVLVNLHFVYYTRTTRTFDCNKNYCCNANERYLRIVSTVAKRISFWKPCQKKEKTKKAGDKNPKKRFVFNRHALLLFLLLCNVVVTVVRDEKRKSRQILLLCDTLGGQWWWSPSCFNVQDTPKTTRILNIAEKNVRL